MPQDIKIGTDPSYQQLPGTVRAKGNAATSPKTVELEKTWVLVASLVCEDVGRYDRNFSVNQRHLFTVSHNVDGDKATLEVQRFAKAVYVTGNTFTKTSGMGYKQWSPAGDVSGDRAVSALCAAQLLSAGLQDDGPRGDEKIKKDLDRRFTIEDAPGLNTTGPEHFPFAMLADFIVRIRVLPQSSSPGGVAEFRYQTYFEALTDPYPDGMRSALTVPSKAAQQDYKKFDDVKTQYSRKPKLVTRTTDDIPIKKKQDQGKFASDF